MRSTVNSIFVDTSGLFALLARDDEDHDSAQRVWSDLARQRPSMITSNYVVLETISLLGRRIGLDSVREFHTDLAPLLRIVWIGADAHNVATSVLLAINLRDLSLVDCVSFELMRQLHLDTAFAYDKHFTQQGFRCLR